jgi:prolyl oligopeptidase
MLKAYLGGISFMLLAGTAMSQVAPPPVAPVKSVTETYFGTTVEDPYRYMEAETPDVIAWMKQQGSYTRAVLDSIPKRSGLGSEIAAFSGSFDFVNSARRAGDRLFYEEQAPGSDNFDLMVKDADGSVRKLVDVSAWRAAHQNKPFAINYFVPSPDASKVAVGLSEGGSENASLFVYDASTGKQMAGPLPRVRFGATGWTNDGKKVFLNQLALLPKGAPGTETYKNSRALVWDLKNPPVALLGGKTPSTIKVPAQMFPFVQPVNGSPLMLAGVINGVQNEITLYSAPISALPRGPAIPWQPVVTPENEVTGLTVSGNRIFLLSHKGAPTFQVLSLEAGQPISTAKVVVPATADRLIEGISAASDALYVQARRGVYSELLRLPLDGGPAVPVALPFKGSIAEIDADPTMPGVVVNLASWMQPQRIYAYRDGSFQDLSLAKAPASFDTRQFVTRDLSAPAADGVSVPLSFTSNIGRSGPGIVLLDAYGSYGISQYPGFGSRTAYLISQGIGYGVCHVRGGGELGENWRLGGKDANKPNTWRDLIACGDYLVKSGYTTAQQLFIIGGSAGGITMGRAMEERPELFAGVIDEVPVANPVRQEFSPNGIPNIPEFGTIKNEAGFRNLYAMDSYLHVKDGTQYPAIMVTTGLNDPRVASWEPAKFAARLQASGTHNPVLLRVDEAAGHGIGSTKTQNDQLYADILSFIQWRAGTPGWTPTAGKGAAAERGR